MELKPCPFCGCTKVELVQDGPRRKNVMCMNCWAYGPMHTTAAAAKRDWNLRDQRGVEYGKAKPSP